MSIESSKIHARTLSPTFANEVTNFWGEMVQNSAGSATPAQLWTALAKIIGDAEQDGIETPYYRKDGPQVVPCGHIDATLLNLFEQADRATARIKNGGVLPATETKPTRPPIAPPPMKDSTEWNNANAPMKDADGNPSQQDNNAKIQRDKDITKANNQTMAEDLLKIGPLLGQAKSVADAQCRYLQAETVTDAITQLRGLASAQGKSFSCPDFFNNDKREEAKALSAALHRSATFLDAPAAPAAPGAPAVPDTRPGGAITPSQVKAKNFNPAAEQVARVLLFAVRSYPVLARLFRFVVDIEVSTEDFKLAETDWRAAEGAQAAFCFLALSAGSASSALQVWTIAKAKRVGGNVTAFWPATREEMELRLNGAVTSDIRNSGSVCQLDGVVDLGQGSGQAAATCGNNLRYSLVTVDPGFAAETIVLAQERPNDRQDAMIRSGATSVAAPFGVEQSASLVTHGLAIADRWRAPAVAAEIETARCWRSKDGSRILDAEDLTIGFRPDIAVPDGTSRTPSWRGLMERDIAYEKPDLQPSDRDDFKIWLTALGLEYRGDRRRELDAAHALPAARRRVVEKGDREKGEKDKEMIHVEELLTTWTGDPLGLACNTQDIPIRPGAELPITRKFDLTKGSAEWSRAPWPLRYGWAYRFGVRPVWLGGVALSLKEAAGIYGSVPNLALPGGDANKRLGWRRFLRHEPILAPIALLPKGTAEEATWLGRQSATTAVLRTSRYDSARSTPTATWRLLLPPHISMDDAMRHGAFDARPAPEQFPAGALANIDFGHDENLTFPAYGAEKNKPLRQTLVPLVRSAKVQNAKDQNQEQGESVFRLKPGNAEDILKQRGSYQFYPDPLAENLVIALRPAGTNLGDRDAYFKGDPLVVRVRSDADDFTKIVPIALAFVTEATDRTTEPRQSDFRRGQPALRNIKDDAVLAAAPPAAAGAVAPTGTITARVVTIVLRPGESVEVDCWFLPDLTALRRYCDLPETLVAMASMRSQAGKPFADALEELLPGVKAAS
jgi:hypothetical protein